MIEVFVTVTKSMGGVPTSIELPCQFVNVELLKCLTDELTGRYAREEILGFEISAFSNDEDEGDDEE